jgi:aminotransferase
MERSATRQAYVEPEDSISLAAGDPNFLLPDYIAKAVYDAIKEGCTHYCFSGDPALRPAIADYYKKFGYEAKLNQIILTGGGSQSLSQAYATVLNPGDEGITLDPAYGGGRGPLRYFGAKTVFAPMKKVNGKFRVNLETIKDAISDKTKTLYLDNPGNPSGAVFTREELKGIADLACDHDFVVISDETYPEFIWGNYKHEAIISYPGMEDRTLVCMSMTKMFSWAGMRTGWIIAGPELAPYVGRALGGALSWPIQVGAVKALTEGHDYMAAIRKEYEERIDYGVKRLNEMPGITCIKPEGAFYLFPDISGTGMTDTEFVQKLNEEEHVRSVSGSNYGLGAAKGYVRFSMIRPLSTQKMPSWFENKPELSLEVAMNRIEKFVKKHMK